MNRKRPHPQPASTSNPAPKVENPWVETGKTILLSAFFAFGFRTYVAESCYIPTGYISGAFISVASDYKQTNSIRKSMKSIAGGVFRVESEHAF